MDTLPQKPLKTFRLLLGPCLLVFSNVSDFSFFVSLCHILEPGDLCGYLEFLDRWSAKTRLVSFISAMRLQNLHFILRIFAGIFIGFGSFCEKIFVFFIRVIPGKLVLKQLFFIFANALQSLKYLRKQEDMVLTAI